MSANRFHCIYCGAEHTTGAHRDERLFDCPQCHHVVPVPALVDEADAGAMSAFPRGVLALELKFLCSACGEKLRIDARWEGRAIQCPLCESATEVPRWSRSGESAPGVVLTAAEIAFLSADDEAAQCVQTG